jgi:hypothetical protein
MTPNGFDDALANTLLDAKGKFRAKLDRVHSVIDRSWLFPSKDPQLQANETVQALRGEVLEKVLQSVDQDKFDDVEDVDDLGPSLTSLDDTEPSKVRNFQPSHTEHYKGRSTLAGTRLIRVGQSGESCTFKPVEFGGSDLSPPDRIKQGQKGAVGALIVLPPKSSIAETDSRSDHQGVFVPDVPANPRHTRLSATVTYSETDGVSKGPFRDYAVIHQKALNLRYRDGTPVQNLAAEREGLGELAADRPPEPGRAQSAPEDSHDAGQMAINYGTEPMWFRFGLAPDSIFGNGGTPRFDPADPTANAPKGLGGVTNAWQAFSNTCCNTGGSSRATTPNVGDPVTGVFEVPAGSHARLHVLEPTGVGRATVFELHGHPWPRDPYLAEKRDVHGFPIDDGGLGSIRVGPNASVDGQHNPMQFWLGGQESVTPQAHFDVILSSAGGRYGVPGDYLFRDHAGFGITNGLWGIMRVTGSKPTERNDPVIKPKPRKAAKKRKAEKLAQLDW